MHHLLQLVLSKDSHGNENSVVKSPPDKTVGLHVEREHAFYITASPRKLKKGLYNRKEQVSILKRKVQASQQKSHGLKSKVKSSKTVTHIRKGVNYSPELCSSARMLQFYSRKAYEFVHKPFQLALPHHLIISPHSISFMTVCRLVHAYLSNPYHYNLSE